MPTFVLTFLVKSKKTGNLLFFSTRFGESNSHQHDKNLYSQPTKLLRFFEKKKKKKDYPSDKTCEQLTDKANFTNLARLVNNLTR